jgi:hypothetical protein
MGDHDVLDNRYIRACIEAQLIQYARFPPAGQVVTSPVALGSARRARNAAVGKPGFTRLDQLLEAHRHS